VARATIERHLGLPGRGTVLLDELGELIFAEIGRSAPPQPGAVELLRALRAEGVPVGVASNSAGALVELALSVAGLEGAFDTVVPADRVAHPKPAPDVSLAACDALGASAGSAVALEDSPTGVAAARAAGMYVVGVPSLEGMALPDAHLQAASLHA